MTVEEIKDLLKSYRDLIEYQEYAKEQIAEIEREKLLYMSRFGGASDGMPRAPGYSDTVSAKVIASMQKYDSEIHSYQRGISQSAERLSLIRRLLRLLPARNAQILRQHYCLGHTWEAVAQRYHYSVDGIKRLSYKNLAYLSQKNRG